MLKYKKISTIILLVLSMSLTVSCEKKEPISISKTEKQAIEIFYNMNQESISKGKYFDIKYAYYDESNVSQITFELVKKNDVKVDIDRIAFENLGGETLLDATFDTSHYDLSKVGFPEKFIAADFEKGFQLYGICTGSSTFLTSLYEEKVEEKKGKQYDFKDIVVYFYINDYKEKHTLHFDQELQFRESQKSKEKIFNRKSNSVYDNIQINYYFGLLFKRDFDLWYKEIKEFAEGDFSKRGIRAYLILHIPYDIKDNDEELRLFTGLNEEQYSRYQEIKRVLEEVAK